MLSVASALSLWLAVANASIVMVSLPPELLEGAVNSHLMSDVPLGVFLSGGLDSSAAGVKN